MAGAVSESVNPIEETLSAKFSNSRRTEFLAGRACARTALLELGYPDAVLTADDEGVPKWPSGTLGSITHTKGLCGAVMAKTSDFFCLGLDFERTGRLSESAAKRVVHPLEADFAKSGPYAPTILFSLKEAFYKAQYPKWQKRANFQDIALAVNLKKESAEIRHINERLEELAEDAGPFHFRITCSDKIVIALCAVPVVP